MGLKSAIASGAKVALNAVKDLSGSTVVYRSFVSGEEEDSSATTFDPVSGGSVHNSSDYTDYPIADFLISGYKQDDIARGIAGPAEIKLIFLQSNISIQPQPTGSVFIDGQEYMFGDPTKSDPIIRQDPAGAIWILRIKLP